MSLLDKLKKPSLGQSLPGREEQMPVPPGHFVHGTPLQAPFPEGMKVIQFGMGCFWGAERKFWEMSGGFCTAVGYGGGVSARIWLVTAAALGRSSAKVRLSSGNNTLAMPADFRLF